MAVTEQNHNRLTKINNDKTGLSALTLAALTLPGLSQPTSALAYEEEASFTYGHYQEGKRDLAGAQSAFSPIEVESLQGSGKFKLSDRIKFAFNYSQDTWGGATPIATAPLAFGGNGLYDGRKGSQANSITGATPYLSPNSIVFDKHLNPLRIAKDINGQEVFDSNGNPVYQRENRLVHTMSLASPEVRKQGDFKLSYEWDNAGVDVGGGISIEDDYESRFGSINSRWDFNQKQTTLNVGLSYTNSDTNAVMDHDAGGYYYPGGPKNRPSAYNNIHKASRIEFDDGTGLKGASITGNRQDWGANIGLTQIINKNALAEVGLNYTRSTGYMDNPYKFVSVALIDPEQAPGVNGELTGVLKSIFENRPNERNQWSGNLRYVQHIEPFNSSVHLGYRIFSDDWGITSHTFDADWSQPLGAGWSITPRIRYYSQSQAEFYTPFIKSEQAFNKQVADPVKGDVYENAKIYDDNIYYEDLTGNTPPLIDAQGNVWGGPNGYGFVDENGKPVTNVNIAKELQLKTLPYDPAKLPKFYSSDHRLSGYGTLSGGVTVTKQFAKGVALDLGFEYYTHQGSMKIGGGGENSFADFDYWTANAALRVNLEAMSLAMESSGKGDHAHEHHHEHGVHAPAGVMFDHMLPKAGQWMAGYRYMYSSQGGTMLNGKNAVGDLAIVNNGCLEVQNGLGCFVTPATMEMSMHMLDIMYAPTDWLTLMLMPQFMDMDMNMRNLEGSQPINELDNVVSSLSKHVAHHVQNGHETGGIGDLGMYALFKLFDNGTHHLHVTGGFTAPTGDVDIQLRRNHQIDGGYIHYGMQLGSGTWDFKPSLTYTGHIDQFSWGAQANGTVRMENKNKSGYRLGDIFQATAWGSYDIMPWLTASVRGVYTTQGAVKGSFTGSENGQFIDPNGDPGATGQENLSSILKFGPMDYPQSYGGKFWDVGFGLSAMAPSGPLAGNRVSVEWLHPVYDNVNGYQLERDGTLSATWSLMF